MSDICSEGHKPLLKRSDDAMMGFKWQELIDEFKKNGSDIVKLLKGMLPKSDERFLAFVISMLLKKRSKFMSLVQHVISVMLYGQAGIEIPPIFIKCINCIQVFTCLSRFMVCMGPTATSPMIDRLAKDYDSEVLLWTNELTKKVQVSIFEMEVQNVIMFIVIQHARTSGTKIINVM